MMKKVSKISAIFLFQLLIGSTVFGQSIYDLSGFTQNNDVQQQTRCDVPLPAYGFGPNGNWLVSTRNANFVGAGASVELANDFAIPNYNVSGQELTAIECIGQQVFGQPDFWEVRLFTNNAAGGPGTQLFSQNLFSQPARVSLKCPPGLITPGVTYWVSCCGVNNPNNNAVARWEWDGTAPGTMTQTYVRYQPGGAWGGAACGYWTAKSACAFLATAGPPEQAMNFVICRNAQLTLGGTPVPTMTQWGLFLFGLVLLTLAVVTIYNFAFRKVQA